MMEEDQEGSCARNVAHRTVTISQPGWEGRYVHVDEVRILEAVIAEQKETIEVLGHQIRTLKEMVKAGPV